MTSKPERAPVTVALVEDDREIREMLTRAVCKTSHFDFVGSFSNGEAALAELPALKPRVVIMDIQLPGMDGVECTQRLKQIMPTTQVLIFTAFMDSDLIFKALAAGASGYLLKRTVRSEIVSAIEEVCHGGAPMSGVIARKVVESFRTPPPILARRRRPTHCTRRTGTEIIGGRSRKQSDRRGTFREQRNGAFSPQAHLRKTARPLAHRSGD